MRVAHALRTPIAVQVALVEAAPSDPDAYATITPHARANRPAQLSSAALLLLLRNDVTNGDAALAARPLPAPSLRDGSEPDE